MVLLIPKIYFILGLEMNKSNKKLKPPLFYGIFKAQIL